MNVSTGFFHIGDEHITVLDLEFYAGILSYRRNAGLMIYLGSHLTEEERVSVTIELTQRYCAANAIGWHEKNFKLYAMSPAPDAHPRKYSFGGARNHSRNPARVLG